MNINCSMNMNCSLKLILALKCELCGRNIVDENVRGTFFYAKLFGAKAYSICPCCHQENIADMNKKNWQQKVNKYITEKYNEIPKTYEVL